MNCCETTIDKNSILLKINFNFNFQLAALCAVSITRDHSCIGFVGVGLAPGELVLIVGAATSSSFDSIVLVVGVVGGMSSCLSVVVVVGLCMSSCLSVVVAGDVLLCVVGGVDMRRTCLCVCGGVCGGVLYSSLFALFAMVEA